jgi:phosphoribosylaminoimidazole-succinocarboxamide synthase
MLEAVHVGSGKVREIYALDDERLLLVASDRISTFDVVLPTPIPDKGRVLTGLSAFWFSRTREIVPNHLLEVRPDGRTMVCRKLEMLPIECVVRGYLAGSAFKDYQATGAVCGIPLRSGLREAERLEAEIFTPATKAESGHDENIAFAEMGRRLGEERAAELRERSLALFRKASAHAEARGIILADTKFEFGLESGRLLWIDEALTPDSSRFWPRDGYGPGRPQPSFDKQFVRDYLETLAWDKRPPGPALPANIVERTREKYFEAFRRLTGPALAPAASGAEAR